jgi:metal-responsive CopG/Arc/MetJ family transcriptional regulator
MARFEVDIPKDLITKVKVASLQAGIKVSQIVETALRAHVSGENGENGENGIYEDSEKTAALARENMLHRAEILECQHYGRLPESVWLQVR